MSFEKLSLFAQGNDGGGGNGDGGYVILFVALIAVVMLVVFIWKSFKPKGAPEAKAGSAVQPKTKPKTKPKMNPALTAEGVVAKRFQPTKFQQGYDQDEVDDLLDKTVREFQRLQDENERLEQKKANPRSEPVFATEPILTPEQVVKQKFSPTKFREGYSQDQVDDFLDLIVLALRQWGSENEQLRAQLTGNVNS